jgi:transposase
MSLPVFSTQTELFSTAGLSGQLFGPADRYRLFAQKVYPVLVRARAQLATCYCAEDGRAATEPVLLFGVTCLQYLEGMPDRQAVEMLRYHAGWNFALNRQVGAPLFHATTLVNFRQRLVEHDLSPLGFTAVLEALMEAGLVARQSRQRLDSTQMFGRVSRMNRLDCVRESLRLALTELAEHLAASARPEWWPRLWERYVESQTDYRASSETLARKLVEAGADAQELLGWLARPEAKALAQGTQAQLLARVFAEQFEVIPATAALAARTKEALDSGRVQNPHDPDATYASKGQGEHRKEHVGYKVQVAESVTETVLAPGEPTDNFITGIVTHAARESDEAGAQKMAAEQAAMGLAKPPVHYVDAAYISTQELRQAAAEGRELIGPAPAAGGKNGGCVGSDRFDVRVEDRAAVCPAGQQNSQCSRLEEQATGRVSYRFEWSTEACAQCPLRPQCIKADQKHRTLAVGEHHTVLQERRREQKTEPFKQRMKHRNAIEGTQSELVRAHGLRRARYRGVAKAKLQNYFAGAACNIKRWLRRAAWKLQPELVVNPTGTASV